MTIIGDSQEVAKVIDIIQETGPRSGIELNIFVRLESFSLHVIVINFMRFVPIG